MRTRITVALLGIVFIGAIVSATAWRTAVWHRIGWMGFRYAPATPSKISLPPALKFLSRKSGEVQLVMPGTPASRAGLRSHDILVSVNGIPIEHAPELHALREKTRRGQAVDYVVSRSDGLHQIRMRTVSPLVMPAVVAPVLTCLGVAAAFVAIAVLVYWNRARTRSAWIFFCLCASAAISFGNAAVIDLEVSRLDGIEPFMNRSTGILLYLVSAVLTTVETGLLLHFALVFPKDLPIVRRFPPIVQWLHGILYLPLTIVGSGILLAAASKPIGGRWAGIAIALLFAGSVIFFLRKRGVRHARELFDHPWPTLLLLVSSALLTIFLTRPLWRPFGPGLIGVVAGLSLAFLYCALWLLYALLTIAALAYGYRLSTVEEKRQVRWPLWGTIVGIGVAVCATALAFYALSGSEPNAMMHVVAATVSLLAYLIIPISFALAILKHRLMDIDVIIRRTVVYSVVTGVIVGGFFVLVAGIGSLITKSLKIESQTLTVIATLLLASVFLPLRNRVQQFVDRRIFRRKYETAEAEKLIGHEILRATELQPLLAKVCDYIQQALQTRSVTILCPEGNEEEYAVKAAIGSPESARGLVLERDALRHVTTASSVGTLRLQDDERQLLRRMQADLAVPLFLRGQLRGVMILGSLLSGEWDDDDRRFIANVSEQIALGIDNLSIGDEVREYERALQIQRALLPSSMPRVAGFDIDAMWKPARTVSGDYFDVIPLDTTLAFCIGDVAGKGMPAALLMANLQAAVKASIRDGHSTSEICSRVSSVVCSTLQSGAFVTFFFGLLDTETMMLRFTNAGHNPPVLLKRDGRVVRLSSGGPAFARLMRNATYTTSEVQLERGDTVFLFTDGVTEARNPDEEEFGEERMLESLRATRPSSTAIVRDLVEQVRDFSHGVVYDDITVLCLRVTGAVSNVVPFARAT